MPLDIFSIDSDASSIVHYGPGVIWSAGWSAISTFLIIELLLVLNIDGHMVIAIIALLLVNEAQHVHQLVHHVTLSRSFADVNELNGICFTNIRRVGWATASPRLHGFESNALPVIIVSHLKQHSQPCVCIQRANSQVHL